MPVINEAIRFLPFVSSVDEAQKFVCWCDEGEKVQLREQKFSDRSSLVLVGPEGDFTPEEVAQCKKHGFVNLSLGANRLRTETAGLAVVLAAALL